MISFVYLITILAAGTLFSGEAHAFTLTPMSVVIEPSGGKSSQAFQLENDSKDDISVEIKITGRAIDPSGKETQPEISNVDDVFLIYPPQLVIKAGQKRTVRITYQGKEKLDKEIPYRLIAEQLPIKFGQEADKAKQKSAEIFVLLKYMAALYVRPDGVSPNVKVEKFSREGSDFLVTLSNKGTEHYIFQNPVFTITSKGKTTDLNPKDHPESLKEVVGQNLLPQSSRVFKLKIPKSLSSLAQANQSLEGTSIAFVP